jgi:DNA repair protein RadB
MSGSDPSAAVPNSAPAAPQALHLPLNLLGPTVRARIARRAQSCARPVTTGCAALDAALGGGFARGALTELVGLPASGRTSVALTACAHAVATGQVAVYVDADGGLLPSRARELVAAAGGEADAHDDDDVDEMLASILRCRVCSWEELAAGVAHALPDIVVSLGNVAVVVVDSVALPYRECEVQGAQKRLEAFAGRMAQMAMRSNAAVILVNNARVMDTAIGASGEIGVAAMGEAWLHVCPYRVALGWDRSGSRVAHVLKSSTVPHSRVHFCITGLGIENDDEADDGV